jgi:diguanylate cyclase (GGDEF)-like protein
MSSLPEPRLPSVIWWSELALSSAPAHSRIAHFCRVLVKASWPEDDDAALDLLGHLITFDLPAVCALLRRLPPEELVRPGTRLLAGIVAARSFETESAVEILTEVVAEARRQDEHLLCWGLYGLALACALSGRRLESFNLINESIERARNRGNGYLVALGECNLGFLYAQDNRPEPYAHHTSISLDLFRGLHDDHGVTFCLANLGGALIELGRLEEAETCLHEGLERARLRDWPKIEAICLAAFGGLAFLRGQPDAAIEAYRASEVVLQQIGEHHGAARHRILVASRLRAAGRLESALEHATVALNRATEYRFAGLRHAALQEMAEIQAAQGDHSAAFASLREHNRLLEAEVEARIQEARAVATRLEAERQERARRQWELERAAALERMNQELREALAIQESLRAELDRASRTDPLTGLANRRALDDNLRWTLHQGARRARPVALLLIDADHFKRINDTFGHPIGDTVLIELARRIAARARASDLVARWGGEEFCALLPDTSAEGAVRFAEALLRSIRETPVNTARGPIPITASLGISVADGGDVNPAELLRQADEALYRAKATGRDRCVLAGRQPPYVTTPEH